MTKAYECAVRLLSRREHSAWEICTKLKRKGFSILEAEQALERCQELDLQSEARFVEVYVRSRAQKGYGPLKIAQELSARGVAKVLVSQALANAELNWLSIACKLWQKKNHTYSNSSIDVQKLQQFLFSRGFSSDLVRHTFKVVQEDEGIS